MKSFIAAILLAAMVIAAPTENAKRGGVCTPATYSCTSDFSGWQVCDVTGNWDFAGSCPPGTGCVFFPPSLSPYCVPPGFQFPA